MATAVALQQPPGGHQGHRAPHSQPRPDLPRTTPAAAEIARGTCPYTEAVDALYQLAESEPDGIAGALAPHIPGSSQSEPPSLLKQLDKVDSPISFKYRLDDIKFPPIDTPFAFIEMRMTGDVLLMSRKRYPATYVTQRREIEVQVTQAANHAFGSLVSDNRVLYDDKNKTVTVRSMLVMQSNTPNAPSTAVGVQINSQNATPKFRFELRFPKLEGTLPLFHYSAVDVKYVIEVTPKARIPPSGPQPLYQPQPSYQPQDDWGRVVGVGLIAASAVIVVGTLVEDFFTAGVGIADDPASFAAAGASLTAGLAMLRAEPVVLPRTTEGATLNLNLTATPAVIGVGPRL